MQLNNGNKKIQSFATSLKTEDFKNIKKLTFDFVTLQDFSERLEQLLQVFSRAHPTQIAHKHLGGVQRPPPRLLHHQISPTKFPSVELPDGTLCRALALQVDEGKLSQHAAADHLAVRFKDG